MRLSSFLRFYSFLRIAIIVGFLLVCGDHSLFFVPFALAASRTPLNKASAAEYMHALAAADRFLQAWQGGDIETGTTMLTAHAKSATSQDRLDAMFSGSAPAAYEIQEGRLLSQGRYEFPVMLLHASPGKTKRSASLVVLHVGSDDWAIDKLP